MSNISYPSGSGGGGSGVSSVNPGLNISITGTATAPIVNVNGTTQYAIQVGASTGALSSLPLGVSGQILMSGGNAANPSWTNSPVLLVPYKAVTHSSSPYVALSTDYYISADVTAGTVTVELPNSPATGTVYVVKDKVGLSSTNNITVTTVSNTDLIDGATTFLITVNYKSANFIFNGTSWEVW